MNAKAWFITVCEWKLAILFYFIRVQWIRYSFHISDSLFVADYIPNP